MSKINIAVLFGGQSSEHEVSCVSATTVIKNLDMDKYNVYMVGITKEGSWLYVNGIEDIESGEWRNSVIKMILVPDRTIKGLVKVMPDGKSENISVDVVFPVLHGLYGEDGTVQGILELAGIPYVGCGVVASAVSMDKLFTKVIVDSLPGIRQAKYVAIRRNELSKPEKIFKKVEEKISYPVFIKPSNAGSSVGVSKAHNREELIKGLTAASVHDEKMLVEETIVGREIECAVFGGKEVKASGVGEILTSESVTFYDYNAKYHDATSRTDTHPVFPEGKEDEIREKAMRIFTAVDGFGLARVDFFLEKDTNEVVFNELNTMPGFTSISMYPMLWEEKGISKKQLVCDLIQNAFERHK